MKNFCASVLENGVDNLLRLVRNLKLLVSSVFGAAYELKKEVKGGANLTRVQSSKHDIWQSQIYINASTSILYTGRDCIYTLIVVPVQQIKDLPGNWKKVLFLLYLNDEKIYSIPMISQTSFIFSGLFITHRQNSGVFQLTRKKLV